MDKPVCVVIGVGPGNGAAIARRFAAEGYATALVARSPELIDDLAGKLGPPARAYRCDVADPVGLEATFSRIQAELGATDVLVYNARGCGARSRRSPPTRLSPPGESTPSVRSSRHSR